MSNLKIEYLPVGDLKPYKRNARKHETKDITAIKASIKEFGFDDPIGIWKDNIIIEGHGRLLAAIELGMAEVPCIRLDHLTDEQRRAYALAHNRTAELSEWDFDVQAAELQEINDIDMSEFGFTSTFSDNSDVERNEIAFTENISVVVECENDEDAENVFTKLTREGYKCHISTL